MEAAFLNPLVGSSIMNPLAPSPRILPPTPAVTSPPLWFFISH
nr:hypothetical protein [Methanobrevibacter wolinii]